MCKYSDVCSFYKKFKKRESLVWTSMIASYCTGTTKCTRYETYEKQGFKDLPSDLMPNGSFASKAFLSLP
jgi:predicted sulfurtransferase